MNGAQFRVLLLGWLFALFNGFNAVDSSQRELIGFKGEAINFTWALGLPVEKVYFGKWNNDFGSIETSYMTVAVINGSVTIHPNNKEVNAQAYLGRVRWVGNVDTGWAVFELSNIQDSDQGFYAIETQHAGQSDFVGNWTQLVVKPPSVFTFGPRSISAVRGSEVEFTWKYNLNNDDRKSLSKIRFGVYKGSDFKEICEIKVARELVKSTNCITSHLAPTTNVTFIKRKVGLDDEAVYGIILNGTHREMRSKTKLIVNDAPKIVIKTKDRIVATENHVLNLTCQATGKPRPIITWTRDGLVVQKKHHSTYTMRYTKLKDAGKYRCIASNIVGSVTSSSVVVDVHYAPRINASGDVIVKPIPMGKEEWLKCPVNANPSATWKWYSNDRPNQHKGENIQIKISRKEDYQNYTCIATNSVGQDKVTFVLKQVGAPSVPKVSCDKREDTSDSLTQKLHWKAPSDDGGDPVIRYTVKYRILRGHIYKGPWRNINVSNTETWYTLKLKWKTTFELTVTAWNKYGESKLDLAHSSCVVEIGTNTSVIPTSISSTSEPVVVVAAAKKDIKPNTPSSSLHIAVYIVPAALAVLVIVVVVALLVKRRRARKHRVKTNWAEHHVSFNALNQMLEPSLLGDQRTGSRGHQTMVGSPRYQMDPNWTIPRERICVLKVIGNGAFGLVYKGRVHGVGTDNVGWTMVAIKSPYADATDSEVRDLMKEFELLKTLEPHPHVIKLLGCGEGDGSPLVIIEYVPFGDLLGYLRKSRGENDDYYSDPEIQPNTNLSSQQLLRFGWNVADGMAYLASQKIIHRDLAARNVLVGEGLACKITDFGMAKDVSNDDIYVRTTEGRLPVKWTAIEALTGSGEYTTQSDVWSFGIVLYEICTIGSDPYPGIVGKEIPDRIERGYRMPRPGHVDAIVYDVMLRCWNKVPEERPTFPELKEMLIKLEEAQSKDYINLAECLYQNVQVNDSKGASGGGDSMTRKSLAKENDYHKGPRLSHSQSWAV